MNSTISFLNQDLTDPELNRHYQRNKVVVVKMKENPKKENLGALRATLSDTDWKEVVGTKVFT